MPVQHGRTADGAPITDEWVDAMRLDPELKRDLLLRAAAEKTSVSEVIRRAIGQYLSVS